MLSCLSGPKTWRVTGPNDPHTWLGEQIRPTYARLGLPDDATVGEVRPYAEEVATEWVRLKQSAEYRRRLAAWNERREQLDAAAVELGIEDSEEVGNDILGEITDVEDEIAELAESCDLNALAAWCVAHLSLGAKEDEDKFACSRSRQSLRS